MVQLSTSLLDGKIDLKPKYAVPEIDRQWRAQEKDRIK